ncbi:MAG: glycosyltransferase [Myxococcales bacterium FL481]|nr:MAG: glycosyltransferase [Myxococcales bacterium FL481]
MVGAFGLVSAIDLALLGLALVFAVPVAVFVIECLVAAALGRGVPPAGGDDAPPFVVLMPAHNESGGIGPVIEELQRQLRACDRLLVVADNCTDDTAAIARRGGASVLERSHASHRGKGYALTHGIDHLRDSPPAVVIIMDADCVVSEGTLVELAARANATGQPMQADYLLGVASRAGFAGRISAFAVAVRNRVRPLGLLRLGLPCQLLGSGMAFPWRALAEAPEMGASLTEDLAMGIELAMQGRSPRFYPWVRVSSRLPGQRAAAMSQRRRWEHGQLEALFGRAPRAVAQGVRHRRPGLVALGLDSMVPPLAFFVALLGLAFGVTLLWGLVARSAWPLLLVTAELAAMTLAIGAAWARYGRHILSLRDFVGVPGYVVSKLGIYSSFMARRKQGEWVRTARDHEPEE